MHWLKQKKVILIVLAALFLVALFLFKNKTVFKNEASQAENGLFYSGNETIEDLVNRDTDKDGVPDWEESLFGTDPTKADTNDDGIPDSVEIAKRRGQTPENGEINLNIQGSEGEENLSQTDKFSRELFSTVATLNQAGVIDQTTVDTLSSSLIEKISNSSTRKIYFFSDINVIKNDSVQAIKNYNDTLNRIYTKYPYPKNTVLDILDKFVLDEENVDESVLTQLDPIIKQTNNIINEMAKMDVPPSLATFHLDALNALQKLSENISDIRLFDTDIIVAMGGISQYQANTDNLQSVINNLANVISQRLK